MGTPVDIAGHMPPPHHCSSYSCPRSRLEPEVGEEQAPGREQEGKTQCCPAAPHGGRAAERTAL